MSTVSLVPSSEPRLQYELLSANVAKLQFLMMILFGGVQRGGTVWIPNSSGEDTLGAWETNNIQQSEACSCHEKGSLSLESGVLGPPGTATKVALYLRGYLARARWD